MDTKKSTNNCNQLESYLRQNILFSRLTDEQLDSMCQYSRVITLKEGETLFRYGDTVHNFYFVYEGLIKLFRQSADGQEKIIEMEGAGKIFAEALMFLDLNFYPVSAAAMKKSTVISISSHHFLKLLRTSNDTCLLIMGDLSKRLHELIGEIDHLSLQTGRMRIANYLLDLSRDKGDEFKLDIPKNAIASLLSLQPETFSRLLKELCKDQIIQVKENQIGVLNKTLLREKAGLI